MRVLIRSFLAIAAFWSMPSLATAQYYWGSDSQMPIQVDSLRVAIKFHSSADSLDRQAAVLAMPRLQAKDDGIQLSKDFEAYTLTTSDNYGLFLDSLESRDEISLVESVYRSSSGSLMPVSDQFMVAFDQVVTDGEIDSINLIHSASIVRELRGMHNVFVLRRTPDSEHRVLGLANLYYNLRETMYSHPSFHIAPEPFFYDLVDRYNSFQPHLKTIIGSFNSASVWDFAGLTRGVVVAVIDDGVTHHEDLDSVRILPGRDFHAGFDPTEEDDDPSPGDSSAHGMACAGIIGANHTLRELSGAPD